MTKLSKNRDGHDTIWVIVEKLTKFIHFLPNKVMDKMEKLTRTYFTEIVRLHSKPLSIISDRDIRFASHFGSRYRSL